MSSPQSDFTPWPPQTAQAYRDAGLWTDESLAHALFEQVRRTPANIALIDQDRQWNYAELFAQAHALAKAFESRGLVRGAYVVVHLPSCAEFFAIIIACWLTGAIPIMAIAAHRKREIDAYIQQSQALAYFGSDQGFAANLEAPHDLQRYCVTAPQGRSLGFTALDPAHTALEIPAPQVWIDLGALTPARVPEHPLALLQLSGGSTGTPKLIPRTHNDYLWSVRASVERCAFDEQTRYLAVLPLGHNFCLSSPGTLGVLLGGGTVVIAKSPQASLAFAQIEDHKVNATALVPSLARMWSTLAKSGNTKIHTLQHLWVGGGPFDPQSAQDTETSLGAKVHQVYGMAEGLVCFTPMDAPASTRWFCQGRPLSSLDTLQVMNPQGRPCAPGEVGELWTQGPYTIRGYFRSAAYNQRAFSETGAYKTGDLVRLREDGCVVVSGRTKQQINRGGEKIASIEVEGLLRLHPQVQDVAVVGMPDPVLGEKSCAVVVWEGQDSLPKISSSLRKFMRAQQTALFKIPDLFVRQDAIPLSRLGKVDRQTLREHLLATSPA